MAPLNAFSSSSLRRQADTQRQVLPGAQGRGRLLLPTAPCAASIRGPRRMHGHKVCRCAGRSLVMIKVSHQSTRQTYSTFAVRSNHAHTHAHTTMHASHPSSMRSAGVRYIYQLFRQRLLSSAARRTPWHIRFRIKELKSGQKVLRDLHPSRPHPNFSMTASLPTTSQTQVCPKVPIDALFFSIKRTQKRVHTHYQ